MRFQNHCHFSDNSIFTSPAYPTKEALDNSTYEFLAELRQEGHISPDVNLVHVETEDLDAVAAWQSEDRIYF